MKLNTQDKLKLRGEKSLVKAIQGLVKKPDGGFIIPPIGVSSESTYVQPRPQQLLANSQRLATSPEMNNFRLGELQNEFLTSNKYINDSVGSSFKARAPKLRFHEKSLGGNLLSTAASFIPGGQFIAPLIGLGEQLFAQPNEPIPQATPPPPNSNIYGNFAKGGFVDNKFVNDGFKQYNTGSHASGNDQPIDQHGNTNSNAVASVQGKENSFMIDGKPFIMSDTLSNPVTGNTFNVDAMKVNKEHKQASYLPEEKNSLNFTMKKLATLNMAMKALTEPSNQMAAGGYPGDPIRNKPWVDVSGVVHQPDPQAMDQPMLNNDLNVPLATDPFGFKTNLDYLPGNYTADDTSDLGTINTNYGTPLQLGNNLAETQVSARGQGDPVSFRGSSNNNGSGILDSQGANAIAL